MNTRALVAEFIGTFTLIFIGAGAGALGAGLVGVAFAHGLVILTFAYAYGHISGAHFNPAVTVGLWVGKQIDTANAVAYIVVQLIGGIVGALVLAFVLGGTGTGLGETVLADGVSPIQGLVLETILTFFWVNAILNTVVSGRAGNLAPVAIGLTLVFSMLMGGPLTGASLNPARTLGPAVISGNFADIWLYFVGPVLGGVLAALLYIGLLKPKD
ncbi:MAG: aquaporin [Rhodobacteraceae bacterium]|nr:aquaporin [Paracoccaceae bacterium]